MYWRTYRYVELTSSTYLLLYITVVTYWCVSTMIITIYAWSVTFHTRDQRNLGDIRVINHTLIRLNNHYPYLRLINHFYYAWSALIRGHAWSITFSYAWTIMFLIYAWSIIIITPDQRCWGDTPDQSHLATPEQSCSLFTLDQSFLLRLISVNPGTRLINHI